MRDSRSALCFALMLAYLATLALSGCGVSPENETGSNSKPISADSIQEQTATEKDKADAFVGFRGRGNEPGWSVEIGQDNIVFITNYGSDRYQLPTPTPEVNTGERRTTYRTRGDGHELVVILEAKQCQDTMADETFEMTVTVTLDGKSLNGCGTPLH